MSQLKTILLSGGMGYIGSHTAIVLAKAGYNVVLYDNLSNSKGSVIDRLNSITGKRLTFIEGDVRDAVKLARTLVDFHVDAVMHFAGLKAAGESVTQPIEYFDNNVGGSISLIKAMRESQIRRLIFSSSATVYGEAQYLPLDEKHPTRATNPYGRSKLHTEEILSDLAKADPSWRIICLRYFNPVGAHESGLIGEEPHSTPNNLMPYIAHVATGKQPELLVFGNDYETKDGTGVRDYIHVMDLAEGHSAALDFLSTNNGWHAINLGTGTGYSVLDIVQAFGRASGKHIPYRIAERRSGDIASCYAKVDKAMHDLNWRAKRTLDDMCASAWKFQSQTDF